jgi:TctA family transporter
MLDAYVVVFCCWSSWFILRPPWIDVTTWIMLVLLQHSLKRLHNSAWWVIIITIIFYYYWYYCYYYYYCYYILYYCYSILLFVFSQVIGCVICSPPGGMMSHWFTGVAQGFLSLTFDSQAYIPFQQHEMIAVFIISNKFSVNSCQPQIDQ